MFCFLVNSWQVKAGYFNHAIIVKLYQASISCEATCNLS